MFQTTNGAYASLLVWTIYLSHLYHISFWIVGFPYQNNKATKKLHFEQNIQLWKHKNFLGMT